VASKKKKLSQFPPLVPTLLVFVGILLAIVLITALKPGKSLADPAQKKLKSSGSGQLTLQDPDCTTTCFYTIQGDHKTHTTAKPLTGQLQGSVIVQHQGNCDYVIASLELYSTDKADAITMQGIDSCANSGGSNEQYFVAGGLGKFMSSTGEGTFQASVVDGQLTYTADGTIH
jgi:hypothetical protein